MSEQGNPCSRQPWGVLLCGGGFSTTNKAKAQVDGKIGLYMDCTCSVFKAQWELHLLTEIQRWGQIVPWLNADVQGS